MPSTQKIYNSSLLFLQGIILVLFSVFIFTHPGELLDKLAFTAGLVAVCTALANFVRYFFSDEPGHFFPDFFTGMVLLGMGFMLLLGNRSARDWLVVAMAVLMVLLALNVFLATFEMKYAFRWWWLSVVTGLGALFIAYLVITGNHIAGIALSTLIAIQVLLLGVLMIWLSILDRRIEREYRKTLKELREL